MSTELFNVADIFGENVFNDTVMQERLPKKGVQEAETDDRRRYRTGYRDSRRHCT